MKTGMQQTVHRTLKVVTYGLLTLIAFVFSFLFGGSRHLSQSRISNLTGATPAHADAPPDVGSSGSVDGGGSGGGGGGGGGCGSGGGGGCGSGCGSTGGGGG